MTVHRNLETGRQVYAALLSGTEEWQSRKPTSLLPSKLVIARVAEATEVSRTTVSKHLTDAVAEGDLHEILVRRDWAVLELSEKTVLYAVPDHTGIMYRLTEHRPESRGSNGISFVTTPSGLLHLMLSAKEKFEVRG